MQNRITPERLERARQFRKEPTPAEALLWELVRDRRCYGLKFKRQEIVERFYVDFYCRKLRLVLEVDGGYHEEPMQKEYDEIRTYYLEQAGLRVLRMRNEGVSEEALQRLLAPLVKWKK